MTDFHARSLIAMHAEMGTVSHFNFWYSPSHFFSKLKPELPSIGLWLSNRCPIIGDMLILANDLTGMTAIALCYINDKNLLRHNHVFLNIVKNLVIRTRVNRS